MTPGMSSPVLDDQGLLVGSPHVYVTNSGKFIDPANPDPDEITIEDIAHHLSQIGRFTGGGDKFYSVAEHSLRVARLVDEDHKLEGILHDAAEYVLSDIAKPVKSSPDFVGYRETEQLLERAVQRKFRLPLGHWPAEVKKADHRMFEVEAKILCPRGVGRFVGDIGLISGDEMPSCWSPRVAEGIFLDEFTHYWGLRERQKEERL